MKHKLTGEFITNTDFKKTFNRWQFHSNIIAIILVLLYGLLAIYIRQNSLNNLDLEISLHVQKIHLFGFQFLMQSISFIGNSLNAVIGTIVIISLFWFKKRVKEAVMILISTLGASFISSFFKLLIARPRPDPKLIHQIGEFLRTDSFPSGHVLFYIGLFGFLLFLAYNLPKENKFRLVSITVFTLMLFLIGLSRIYLGAHWFSDTLGSYLVGIFWLNIIIKIYSRWSNKYE